METNHTKGTWNIDLRMAVATTISELKTQWIDINNDLGHRIAEVKGQHYKIPESEMHANAKLIAAAPELLEALIASLPYVKHSGLKVTVEKIEQLIEKATEPCQQSINM